MSGAQWLGVVILALVFGGMFVGMGVTLGWLDSLIVWGGALTTAGLIVLAAYLITGGAS